ncbi:hypothetical protein Kpol_303p3 [Vanderwaltozyma polyspora DSM 70294]|uniref:CS domain-containing protein n=1 Tax=Vanderwaltozyma polyspora (strain ATCC 22028 / DSM 70294 / BCRC 21397 / CBS 2163 / NBRC 10782 / NRRL Y-8283 / UCD 57-17) TaxID=436907 RepID=A7TT00_VANPO|nr:uncharacterized protein Kpol_303p3 [Vanderwaltozyma polyspora DSM 70294]EDO14604.1 hypothetical protein Kpol_303p3 [Vanderwaltozyma polyspora DSM 70294]
MPVEKDLDSAYKILYDDKNYLKALQLYDKILSDSNYQNLTAFIYKAASLEKLYFSSKDWANDDTLAIAKSCLDNAKKIALERGDRSKIGLVYFRYFIYYYNLKDYKLANENFLKSKNYDYNDSTLPMWEIQLNEKLKNLNLSSETNDDSNEEPDEIKSLEKNNTDNLIKEKPNFKIDWYQTNKNITISIFTTNLPTDKNDIKINYIAGHNTLEVTYKIPDRASEFQYSINLSYPIISNSIKSNLFTKKIEIILEKSNNISWKSLEKTINSNENTISSFPDSNSNPTSSLMYPNSSKKNIDWSKIDYDDEDDEDEDSGTADAFFRKLYEGADPDTKRAMMKSYLESNGTALNTNWEDVAKGEVETSPPEGMELKHW